MDFVPVSLPADFPVRGGSVYVQGDAPISRLHVHDCLEIGYCLSGTGIFVVEDKVLPFQAGDVSAINSRELHLAQSARGTVSEWTWIMLDPLRLAGASADDALLLDASRVCGGGFGNILSGDAHAETAALVRTLIAELGERPEGYRSAVRGLVLALMVRLRRLPGQTARANPMPRRDDLERVAPALQRMARQYMDPLDLAELARQCGLSPTHFRRVFRQATGRAPLDYLHHVRLNMAGALLQGTNRTVLDIALDAGWPSLSAFYRNFRSATGLSPRAWRKRRKAAEVQGKP
jgi:AraC-like DNA-binding protein